MAIVSAVIGLVGVGISAWANWWGQKKNEEQFNIANTQQTKYTDISNAFERQQYREQKANLKKEWAWREEDKNYQRKLTSIKATFDLLSKKPELENHMINIWKQ